MREYHKINSLWKRELKGAIIHGEYSHPIFEYLRNNVWVFTEKVDGTNIRIGWDGKQVSFGGRTDAASIPTLLVNHLKSVFTEEKLRAQFQETEVTLYGEGYGANIQKSGESYKADGQSFVLFDVLIGNYWLERPSLVEIADALGIDIVPVVFTGTLSEAEDKTSTGIKSEWGNFKAEGLVGKPLVEMLSRNGGRVIVKMKTKDYENLPAMRRPSQKAKEIKYFNAGYKKAYETAAEEANSYADDYRKLKQMYKIKDGSYCAENGLRKLAILFRSIATFGC